MRPLILDHMDGLSNLRILAQINHYQTVLQFRIPADIFCPFPTNAFISDK